MGLNNLGFRKVSQANSYSQAIDKLQDRNFQIIIFDAKIQNNSSHSFVKEVLHWDDRVVLIPVSANPQIDDVFGLLGSGARGYIVTPFTADSLSAAVERALDEEPLNEVILQAPDRNAALVGLVLNSLYRFSVVARQSREFASAKHDLETFRKNFHENVNLAKLFCEGGEKTFLDKLMEACLERSQNAASRLGRTRKRLKRSRQKSASV